MNQVSKYESNMFEKYAKYKSSDTVSTDVTALTADQKNLVEKALNQVFINPKFKLRHFTSMGQLTPYGTLKQWLLELKTCEENLETFNSMIARLIIEIEILDIKIQNESDLLQKKLHELEREKKNYDLNANKRRHASHYIERDHYIELIEEYLEGPNGKTPDGRSWMEVFGTPEEDHWEKHYWTVRLARQGAMDLAAYGRIGAGNLEAINQMYPDQRNETLALAHEVALRLDSLQGDIRQSVHNQLLATDPEYARVNANVASPRDPNYVALDFSLKSHTEQAEIQEHNNTNNGEELLDVYRP